MSALLCLPSPTHPHFVSTLCFSLSVVVCLVSISRSLHDHYTQRPTSEPKFQRVGDSTSLHIPPAHSPQRRRRRRRTSLTQFRTGEDSCQRFPAGARRLVHRDPWRRQRQHALSISPTRPPFFSLQTTTLPHPPPTVCSNVCAGQSFSTDQHRDELVGEDESVRAPNQRETTTSHQLLAITPPPHSNPRPSSCLVLFFPPLPSPTHTWPTRAPLPLLRIAL